MDAVVYMEVYNIISACYNCTHVQMAPLPGVWEGASKGLSTLWYLTPQMNMENQFPHPLIFSYKGFNVPITFLKSLKLSNDFYL